MITLGKNADYYANMEIDGQFYRPEDGLLTGIFPNIDARYLIAKYVFVEDAQVHYKQQTSKHTQRGAGGRARARSPLLLSASALLVLGKQAWLGGRELLLLLVAGSW